VTESFLFGTVIVGYDGSARARGALRLASCWRAAAGLAFRSPPSASTFLPLAGQPSRGTRAMPQRSTTDRPREDPSGRWPSPRAVGHSWSSAIWASHGTASSRQGPLHTA